MFRYQLIIEYVGTNFRGWQIQKKGLTIQGLIQHKLTKLLKEKIILNGSGRTDAGVHSQAQSAHFDCKNKIIDLTKFLKSINHFLNNKGIAITKIKKRNSKFHSRYSAKQRIYRYVIFNQISEPVIEKNRGWQIQKKGLTIQGLIQDKLTKLLKEKIILNGSGRTDTGVHAIEQSAHFDCNYEILDLIKFLKSINHFLNDQGIAIKKINKQFSLEKVLLVVLAEHIILFF